MSCKARVAASWRATIKTRQRQGAHLKFFMGGPTLRDKRPKINDTWAIQRSSPLHDNDPLSELRLVLPPIVNFL